MNAPEHNPLFRTLQALAAPADWAVVTRDADSRPERLKVKLTMRRGQTVRHLVLNLGEEGRAQEVWDEFELWFSHPKKVIPVSPH